MESPQKALKTNLRSCAEIFCVSAAGKHPLSLDWRYENMVLWKTTQAVGPIRPHIPTGRLRDVGKKGSAKGRQSA